MTESRLTRHRLDDLRRLATDLASRVDVLPARASALATYLLWFDAAGASSHGIATLPDWLDRIERKEIDAKAEGRAGFEHSGTAHVVDVPIGLSVMRGAIDNNVPGIDADCGGECACATCHVYIEPEWETRVGNPVEGTLEASMLSFAAVTQDNSRLSCQIEMRAELDGLVVRLPDGQH